MEVTWILSDLSSLKLSLKRFPYVSKSAQNSTEFRGLVNQLVSAAAVGDHNFAAVGEILGYRYHVALGFIDVA